ncbi:MAG: hypothetical protein IPJ87_10190 [Flavobacteriales bacterium]|nr:hypothetical protein [Flavobacteriales bacterium]MBK7942223.1 hypothetical protein [Flavobacteriales bacterium]MBK9701861.1 hypothetical protein [Flavobacteriales bacterium]
MSFEEYDSIKLTARRCADNRVVHAAHTNKSEGPFYCPDTYEELIVRKCIEARDHFAYKARLSPTASRESDLHLACKDEMVAVLQKKFPSGSWSLERKDLNADTSKGYTKVEPDISGRIGNNKAVVIEVQASTLPINTILHRTEQYTKRGAFILWVVPLTEDLGTTTFRPRLFERFLHTIYYGRVYYWLRGYGTQLQPVHFGKAERYIEVSNWFEPDGSERVEGGYNKPYKRVKTPLYGDLVDLTEQFETHSRDPFELENDLLSVPSAKIFRDTLEPWW